MVEPICASESMSPTASAWAWDLLQGTSGHAVRGVAGAGREAARGASGTVRSCCPTGPGERQAAAGVLDLERLADEVDAALGEFGARCADLIDMNAHVLVAAVLQADAQVVRRSHGSP